MLLPITQTVSSKGQVVIPAKFRKALDIKAGTKLIVSVDEEDKKITATPAPKDPVEAACGILRKYGFKKGDLDKMLKEKRKEIEYEDRWLS